MDSVQGLVSLMANAVVHRSSVYTLLALQGHTAATSRSSVALNTWLIPAAL